CPSLSRRALLAAIPAVGLAGSALAQSPAVPTIVPPIPVLPPIPPAPPPPVPIPPLSRAQQEAAVRTVNAAYTHRLARQHLSPDDAPDAITTALLRYAKEVHVGRLAPGDFLSDWGVRPPYYEPSRDLAAAVTGDRLEAFLDSLPPPYAGYNALR